MKVYGLKVAEGSTVTNLIVPQGGSLPSASVTAPGALFYLTDPASIGLYIFFAGIWHALALTGTTGLSSNSSNLTLNITSPTYNQILGFDGSYWVNRYAPGYKRIVISNTYTATLADTYIGVQHTAAITITLPVGVENKTFVIKDEKGVASTAKTITVHGSNGQTIDMKTSLAMKTAYGSTTLLFGDNNWNII